MIDQRFASTGDAVMMELSFVLTVEGHRPPLAIVGTLDAMAIPREQLLRVSQFATRSDALREKFAELGVYVFPDIQPVEFGRAFEDYLLNAKFWGAAEQTRTGWNRRALAAELSDQPVEVNIFDDDLMVPVTRPAPRRCHVHAAFAKLARLLTEMPASEAAAERARSIFEFTFDKTQMSSGLDLIQAELMIRSYSSRAIDEKPPPRLRRSRRSGREEAIVYIAICGRCQFNITQTCPPIMACVTQGARTPDAHSCGHYAHNRAKPDAQNARAWERCPVCDARDERLVAVPESPARGRRASAAPAGMNDEVGR
jgi:hypothetical protein